MVSGENHRHITGNLQLLSCNIESSTPKHWYESVTKFCDG